MMNFLKNQAQILYPKKKDVNTEINIFATLLDILSCRNAIMVVKGAKLLLCEATYLEEHSDLAKKHRHLTARQAAEIAKEVGAQQLVLTHFSGRYLDLKPFLTEALPIFPNIDVAEDFKRFDFPR